MPGSENKRQKLRVSAKGQLLQCLGVLPSMRCLWQQTVNILYLALLEMLLLLTSWITTHKIGGTDGRKHGLSGLLAKVFEQDSESGWNARTHVLCSGRGQHVDLHTALCGCVFNFHDGPFDHAGHCWTILKLCLGAWGIYVSFGTSVIHLFQPPKTYPNWDRSRDETFPGSGSLCIPNLHMFAETSRRPNRMDLKR